MTAADGSPAKATDVRPMKAEVVDQAEYGVPGDGVTAGTLIVILSSLALVAYLVVTMRSDPPSGIIEILAGASGLLAAAAGAARTMRRKCTHHAEEVTRHD
jgi:hypothetical protein